MLQTIFRDARKRKHTLCCIEAGIPLASEQSDNHVLLASLYLSRAETYARRAASIQNAGIDIERVLDKHLP